MFPRATPLLVLLPCLVQAQAPTISSISPAPNARAAARTSPVSVSFSQALTPASAAALKIYSAQRGGQRTLASPAVVSGNSLTFVPTAYPFYPGENIRYTVTQAVASASSPLARPLTGQFTAATGGTGRAEFATPAAGAQVQVSTAPRSVALGDVDNDGDLDLLTANSSGGSVSVRLNDGAGQFLPGSEVPVGNGPLSVALGDVDADGDLDLVSANYSSFTVSIRLNNGTGGFTVPASNANPSTGAGPAGLALGDVDGDGDLDLVVANYSTTTLTVLLNSGAGSFTALSTPLTVGLNPYSVALGDIDNDGDLDVLAANAGMLINSTVGTTVSVLLNNGTGSFTAPATGAAVTVGSTPFSVALGDVDADGDLDMVVANLNSGSVSVRFNNGRGLFTAPAPTPDILLAGTIYSVALGDVDADGDLDMVIANAGLSRNLVNIRLNDGAGHFAAAAGLPEPAVPSEPHAVALGDIDNDGDMDLVTANRGPITAPTNTVSVRLNQPRTLTATTSGYPRSKPLAIFPNPASQAATLTGAGPGASIEVRDVLGRVVYRTRADAAGTATVPIDFIPGVYLVQAAGQAPARLLAE